MPTSTDIPSHRSVIHLLLAILLLAGPWFVESVFAQNVLFASAGPLDGKIACGGSGAYEVNVTGGVITRVGDTGFKHWAVGSSCWRFNQQYTRVYITANDPATFDHWESPSGHIGFINGHNGTTATTVETSFNTNSTSPTFQAIHTGGSPTPDLLTVNETTGGGAVIGSLSGGSSPAYPALAVHPTTGVLYAGGGGGSPILFQVNPLTGVLSAIGSAGGSIVRYGAMDFRSDGTLFAAVTVTGLGGEGANHLTTINVSTGLATLIGPFGSCGGTCSIEGMEGLAFDDSGSLYGTLHYRGAAGTPGLYTINTSTGAASFVGSILNGGSPPSGGIISLQFVDRMLYGGTAIAVTPATDGGRVVQINKSTGAFSFVGGGSATGGRGLNGLALGIDDGSFDCTIQSQIPPVECEALVALYDSTNGDSWTTKTGWKTTNEPCDWHGVRCADGRVSYLTLQSNGLSGSIPSQLGELTDLAILFMHNNDLSGSIPPELSHLSGLVKVSLYSNNLSGNIPSELSQLNNLTALSLSSNDLTGTIPPELGQLDKLRTLYIHTNALVGPIPPELGQLGSLEVLRLEYNALSGIIPAELGRLDRLDYLSLFGNNLSGMIPPELGQLSMLEYLLLYYNDLSGEIPTELSQLHKLKSLELQSNDLSGTIPRELGLLDSLLVLRLDWNNLSGGIPVELAQLDSLQILLLGSNNLSGSIPRELGELSDLYLLSLDGNSLSGTIPPELGQLDDLRWLHLGLNDLSGSIPPEFGKLSKLEALGLGKNGLTGTVPLALAAIGSALDHCHLHPNAGLCMPDIPAYQALGNPICGLPLDPACSPVVHASTKVLMEGAYSGSDTMSVSPTFAASLPFAQPYVDAIYNGTPLNHDNTTTVTGFPGSTIDWVLASLRTGTGHATEVVGSKRAALLLADGSVVDTNGTTLAFHGVAPGPYRLVIRHRNHTSVMSSDTLDLSDGLGSWDFTTAMAKAYTASPAPMQDLGDGRFAMFAGDASIDGQITAPDFNAWLVDTKAVLTGYLQTDFDLDGQVTAVDFNAWLVNTKAAAASQVPDP